MTEAVSNPIDLAPLRRAVAAAAGRDVVYMPVASVAAMLAERDDLARKFEAAIHAATAGNLILSHASERVALQGRIADLEATVDTLAEKLAACSESLGRAAERKGADQP